MKKNYILQYKTLFIISMCSIFITVILLLFSTNGLHKLHKQRLELAESQYQLRSMYHYNLELIKETHRFAIKDLELYESLARQRGLVRPGESIYIFRSRV